MEKETGKPTLNKSWGLLPEDVRQLILKREWASTANLKARILGHKPFPIRIGLKPPTGKAAIADMAHFQNFVQQWRSDPQQEFIQWETRSYRTLSEQQLPRFFILNDLEALIEYVGDEARQRSKVWQTNMAPLLDVDDSCYSALIKHLDSIEQMSVLDAQLLADIVPQLSQGMGLDQYLRALPLVGADTKFLEKNQALITAALDALYSDSVSTAGGLLTWLGCLENPKGWLTIRPLCEKVRSKMGGFPVLQLPGDVLRSQALPADNILVVENMQSGLALPYLDDTVAIFGGGKNVAWMDACWLKDKRVAYWGDIDTWGLSILSEVRSKLTTIMPLMMEMETLRLHEDRMVMEPAPSETYPAFLTDKEREIFHGLKSATFKNSRLEQERLSSDYIVKQLKNWLT